MTADSRLHTAPAAQNRPLERSSPPRGEQCAGAARQSLSAAVLRPRSATAPPEGGGGGSGILPRERFDTSRNPPPLPLAGPTTTPGALRQTGGGLRGMSEFTLIGTSTKYHGGGARRLSLLERTRHVYVLGKTGSGKSTFLSNLITQDLIQGWGVGVIDPHGELAEELLAHIPRSRTREVVYINLADTERPIAWNPLEPIAGLAPATLAFSIVSACKHIWRESWGPRMEYVLTNSLQALIEARKSFLHLPQFLSDDCYRAELLDDVFDPKVLHFFEQEFAAFDSRTQAEIISPIQNKIGQLLLQPTIRNMLAYTRGTVRLNETLARGQILVVNLAKGQVGEEPANLFGSLLVSVFGALALARCALPKETWKPFLLSIDEFHNFSTEAFAGMLSEVRKYQLGLVLAHQYLGQLKEPVRKAVLGNVGTKVLLGVGVEDAERLGLECRPYAPSYLLEVEAFAGLLRAQGGEAEPIRLFPPIDTRRANSLRTGRGDMIRQESRRRFGVARTTLEQKVQEALQTSSRRRSGGVVRVRVADQPSYKKRRSQGRF